MKKEKRNLFEFIFGKKKQNNYNNIPTSQFQLLNAWNGQFTPLGKGVYDSKVARQCIDRIATNCAKLVPKHIKSNITNNIQGEINYLLSQRPNPIQNTYDFIYKIISMLYTDCNAFVYIAKDKTGFITGFYPVLAISYDLLEAENGTIYLKFQFVNGEVYAIPYLELIHLRLFYNQNDIFGSSNKVLKTDLETAHTASEGIKNSIKLTNNLKGIIQYENAMLKNKDLVKTKEDFVKDFLNLENESGIAALDAKARFTAVDLKPVTLDKDQLEQVNYNIFDYFGISEKIIRNDYNENEWNAFFEGVIEPRAIQMSYEFTNKIFKKQSIKEGHKIVFTANRLQYASLSTKIKVLKEAGDRSMLKVDEGREILDLPPIGGEEGNKLLQSLNFVDSKIANQYQGGKEDE